MTKANKICGLAVVITLCFLTGRPLLAADSLIIHEFMAVNETGLDDEDGNESDWIEIRNTGTNTVNLEGWYLTDKTNNLAKWEFPAVTLAPNGYLVVFASEKNRRDPESELHTNFKLTSEGEYLGLVAPDGVTVVSEFFPTYPIQAPDVSYGVSGSSEETVLLAAGAPARALIPSNASLEPAVGADPDEPRPWTVEALDDSGWASGTTGIGYDRDPNYLPFIGLNVAGMDGVNGTVYIRIPFEVEDPTQLERLTLRIQYDDGFIAYINGQESVSALANTATATWNSLAAGNHPDAEVVPIDFDITTMIEFLHVGRNLLAIQGLNQSVGSSDLLIRPELLAVRNVSGPSELRYFPEPTPGEPNTVGVEVLGPIITEPAHTPRIPEGNEEIVVTARVEPAFAPLAGAVLYYRVMFNAESQLAMLDDGAHGDGESGDGVYGARIPATAYSAGQMVRWRILASDTQGRTSRLPLFANPVDSAEYLGTAVNNPALVSDLPIFQWFAANPAAGRTRGGTRGAVFLNGELYDNVFIRERGGATTANSQKFDFNRGGHAYVNELIGRVEEMNMNGNGWDATYLRPPLAFESYRLAGNAACESFPMLMYLNGARDRVSVYVEQVDDEFLDRNGLDPEGALYKFVQRGNLNPVFSDTTTGIEKKTRRDEDFSDLQAFVDGLNLPTLAQREAFVFDNVNLPQLMTYLAGRCVTLDADDVRKNFYMHRDTRGNGEWSIFPWDKDWTFGVEGDGAPYLHHPFFGDQAHAKANANQWNVLWNVLFNTPSTREMFLRRLRTVMDEQLQPPTTSPASGLYEQRVDAWAATIANELSVAGAVTTLRNWFPSRRNDLYVLHSATNTSNATRAGIPESQAATPTLSIGEVDYNPASGNQDQEYIQLVNNNNVAVDISGWQLRGAVELDFQPGTVILANDVLYASPNVTAFRARTVGPRGGQSLFVQGDYRGRLSARGETIQLRDQAGRVVSVLSYPGTPSLAQQQLRVTEIMYHPVPPFGGGFFGGDYEFVELKNLGPETLDLNGVRFADGISFGFAGSAVTSLAAGETVLVVKNLAAFTERYGSGFNIAGEYEGNLSNGGERVRLLDAHGEEILDFSYNDNWYGTTDGFGFSLVIADENGLYNTWDEKSSWQPSGALNGSPDGDDPGPAVPWPVFVNEVLTHTDPPLVDQVELYNPNPDAVNVGGWFLTDDWNTPRKFQIPAGTTIGAGGYLVYTEADFNPLEAAFPTFAFGSDGDEVYLFSADLEGNLTGYVHGYRFGAAENGVSFGRYVTSIGKDHLVAQSANSLLTTNAGPKVGPVVISEIMFHPPDFRGGVDNQREEFVELRNVTDDPVPLYDVSHSTNTWVLSNAVYYVFPQSVTLDRSASLVVVSFDPSDPALMDPFRQKYALPPGTPVFGPYAGKLDNSSESVELYKPDPPNLGAIPYVLVDKVDYDEAGAWPTGADGTGASLQRLLVAEYGDDPVNWGVGTPTAGRAFSGSEPPVIILQPVAQNVYPDGSVTLTVEAVSGTGLSYEWRKDGQPLPGQTASTLIISPVTVADDGFYDVVVRNAVAAVLSEAVRVAVLVEATVIRQPQSVTNYVGSTVALSVEVTNTATLPITYLWRRGSLAIGTNVTSFRTDYFWFENIQLSDAYPSYNVVISNPAQPPRYSGRTAALVVLSFTDSDGDGLPDDYEDANGLNKNLNDAGEDLDMDGSSNHDEFVAGTDPQNPNSFLRVDEIVPGGAVTLRFQAVANKNYTVQYTDQVGSGEWAKLVDVVAGSETRLETVTDPEPSPVRIYRLVTPRQASP